MLLWLVTIRRTVKHHEASQGHLNRQNAVVGLGKGKRS